jgi:hypothetical protein
VQAVQIEPVKADALLEVAPAIVTAQPVDEVRHGGVAPHPSGEAFEAGECRLRVGGRGGRRALDEAVDPIGVRPVAFDRNGGKSALLDQRAAEFGAQCVEFMRAMRRFADQHDRNVADLRDDPLHIAFALQRMRGGPNRIERGVNLASGHGGAAVEIAARPLYRRTAVRRHGTH